MPTRNFTFTVQNIDEALVLPVAVKLGYQENVNTTEEKTISVTYADYQAATEVSALVEAGAYDITPTVIGLEPPSTVVIAYKVDTTSPTTQTVEEFINGLFKDEFVKKVIEPAFIAVMTAQVEAEKAAKEAELEAAKTTVAEQLAQSVVISTQ